MTIGESSNLHSYENNADEQQQSELSGRQHKNQKQNRERFIYNVSWSKTEWCSAIQPMPSIV